MLTSRQVMQAAPSPNFVSDRAKLHRFHHFPRWAGVVVALMGGLILVCSRADWPVMQGLIPGTDLMPPNAALCFILLGTGLFLLTTRWRSLAVWLGAVTGLLAGLTLLEYLSGHDLGIDFIFSQPAFPSNLPHPGRISPVPAICFIFLSLGLVLGGLKTPLPRRQAGAGLLACAVGVINVVALGGYFFGVETSHGSGVYFHMTVIALGLLLLCSGGLLAWATQVMGPEFYFFRRWLPATGAVAVLVMVGLGMSVNTSALHEATYWRQHTFQNLLHAQAFSDNLLMIQGGLRDYVTLGDTNALAAYRAGRALEPQQLAGLLTDTQDNAAQQQDLQSLGRAMQDLLDYDEHVLAVDRQAGYAGVCQLDLTGQGRTVYNRARELLQNFSTAEQKLLVIRDASETADYNKVSRLLIAARATALALLLVGYGLATVEMRRRRQTEARLTATLTLQNAIFNSAGYAIVSMDHFGVIRTFNPAAEKILGYQAGEIIGRATPQLWSEVKNAGPAPKKMGMETLLARAGVASLGESETTFVRKDGQPFPALVSTTALADTRGEVTGFLTVFSDISERRLREAEREKLIADLKAALAEVKTLSGLIPICAWCKSVRSDKGFWQTVEQYVHTKTSATFSHGICPECAKKMLPGVPRQS